MHTKPDPVAHQVAGCLLLVGSLVTLVWSLGLQFHIENTDDAIYETAVGTSLLGIAWLAAPCAIVAIVVRRRAVGIGAVVVGVVVLGFAVTRARLDLDPERGERDVASAFASPGVGVGVGESDYEFPSLTRTWRVPGTTESAVCDVVGERMRAWSTSTTSTAPDPRDGCWFVGHRDGHDGTVSVRADFDDPSTVEVVLQVTRRV